MKFILDDLLSNGSQFCDKTNAQNKQNISEKKKKKKKSFFICFCIYLFFFLFQSFFFWGGGGGGGGGESFQHLLQMSFYRYQKYNKFTLTIKVSLYSKQIQTTSFCYI